jgi:hypothetical protein
MWALIFISVGAVLIPVVIWLFSNNASVTVTQSRPVTLPTSNVDVTEQYAPVNTNDTSDSVNNGATSDNRDTIIREDIAITALTTWRSARTPKQARNSISELGDALTPSFRAELLQSASSDVIFEERDLNSRQVSLDGVETVTPTKVFIRLRVLDVMPTGEDVIAQEVWTIRFLDSNSSQISSWR